MMVDIFGLTGAVLIVSGVAVMHYPTAMIVGGLMLLAPAVIAARRTPRSG